VGYPHDNQMTSWHMTSWAYVVAAYGLVAAILLGYWRHVERRIRHLEAELRRPR